MRAFLGAPVDERRRHARRFLPLPKPLGLEARRYDHESSCDEPAGVQSVASGNCLRRLPEAHVVREEKPPRAKELPDAFPLIGIELAAERAQ